MSNARALILIACLAAAGCGGGDRAAPAQPGAVSGGSRVADRCATRAGGDPSRMMLCLSAHRLAIPDGLGFRACVSDTRSAAGAVECMRRLAR